VVDDGESFDALGGALVSGRVEVAEDDPRLSEAERLWYLSQELTGTPELAA
jgi:hypothetical protein